MSAWPLSNGRLVQIAFLLALVLAWICYQPSLSGTWQLDDRSNLESLQQVSDFDSGLNFVLSGSAGPLGRPIALATFAMQAGSWESGAVDFIRVNLLIHLLNAVLLAFCVFRLSLFLPMSRDRAMSNAALVAGAWVLLPLLATSTMLVVQRMTTLSAMFALLGLGGYLVARARLNDRPQRALLLMSISLIVGTLLSAFCKESGLLLPVLVLTLEATVLQSPGSIARKYWRLWQLAFLGMPLLVILAYLSTIVPYPEVLSLRRGFTGFERLLTEAGLLWVYLGKAIVGHPDSLGIFQDTPPVVRSLLELRTLVAVALWLMLLAAAIIWRRRLPLLALAVLWYLAGHLIESTTVPLELYFEHRNYLPIIGPLFALCSFALLRDGTLQRTALAFVISVSLVNAYFLYVFASLWGEPSMTARYWAMRYPDSVRAVTTLATYQLAEESAIRGAQTLAKFVRGNPQHAYLRIQQLNIACRLAESEDHTALVQELHRRLPDVEFTYTAGTMLSQLFDASVATNCKSVGVDTVASLADSLHKNYRYRHDHQYNQFHHKLLAGIARYSGDSERVLENLRSAIGYQPSSELNFMMVTALVDVGDFAAAHDFISDARRGAPRNPLRAVKWNRDLDELAMYVQELEKQK